MSDRPPEPDDLRSLEARLEEMRRRDAVKNRKPAPNAMGIAFRFTTELVAAIVVGGAMGWGLDWAFAHWTPFRTKPVLMIVFFVLGAAAGIRNVISAAKELNERAAAAMKNAPTDSIKDEGE